MEVWFWPDAERIERAAGQGARARLIQGERLDSKSAADVATTLAYASQSFAGLSAASIDDAMREA